MPSRSLMGLLVGVQFNPIGRTILQHLPGGTELILQPEPENQYDSNAIKVLADPAKIPEGEYEELSNPHSGLPYVGATLEQVLSGGAVMLGHIGKSGGKPLEKAKIAWPAGADQLAGNVEFLDWLSDSGHEARLGFDPMGGPLVMLRIDEEEPEVV